MTTGRPRRSAMARYRAVDFLPMPEHTNAAANARRPWLLYVVSDLLVYAAFVVVIALLALLIARAIVQ